MSDPVDLGDGFSMRYFGWHPDRALNPQYDHIPNIEKAGVTLYFEEMCFGAVYFDTPENRLAFPYQSFWKVIQEEPLTLNPSILDPVSTIHGFITNGKWVRA